MKFPKFEDLILFEDKNLIVVNKPAFMSSLDDREGGAVNLLRLAKQYSDDAQVCHRLDRETSGAIIIAKNPETYRFISMQFEHRKVDKLYHALINGTHHFEELTMTAGSLGRG